MNKIDWSRLPLLVVVVLLMLGGAQEYVQRDEDQAAMALIAAGLLILGSWLAVEVIAIHKRLHDRDGPGGPDDTAGGDGG